MSNFMFRELYHRWLNTRTLEKTCCPIRKMVPCIAWRCRQNDFDK